MAHILVKQELLIRIDKQYKFNRRFNLNLSISICFIESRQGLLYTGTDFLPNQISKKRPKYHFNANKSGVAKIPRFT